MLGIWSVVCRPGEVQFSSKLGMNAALVSVLDQGAVLISHPPELTLFLSFQQVPGC